MNKTLGLSAAPRWGMAAMRRARGTIFFTIENRSKPAGWGNLKAWNWRLGKGQTASSKSTKLALSRRPNGVDHFGIHGLPGSEHFLPLFRYHLGQIVGFTDVYSESIFGVGISSFPWNPSSRYPKLSATRSTMFEFSEPERSIWDIMRGGNKNTNNRRRYLFGSIVSTHLA